MLFSELYKIMVNKVTFMGFRGGDRPNRPPSGPAPGSTLIQWDLVGTIQPTHYLSSCKDCVEFGTRPLYWRNGIPAFSHRSRSWRRTYHQHQLLQGLTGAWEHQRHRRPIEAKRNLTKLQAYDIICKWLLPWHPFLAYLTIDVIWSNQACITHSEIIAEASYRS